MPDSTPPVFPSATSTPTVQLSTSQPSATVEPPVATLPSPTVELSQKPALSFEAVTYRDEMAGYEFD